MIKKETTEEVKKKTTKSTKAETTTKAKKPAVEKTPKAEKTATKTMKTEKTSVAKVSKAEKTTTKPTNDEKIHAKTTKNVTTETTTKGDNAFATTTPNVEANTPETVAIPGVITTFADMNLKPGLQQAIDGMGYTNPTQIQKEVWNAAMKGSNIVGQSQTGTGKTTAFLLPILQQINNRDRFPQVLIVAPTRELVQQIREDIMKLTEFYPMRSLCVIGGRKLMFQKEDLKYGPQFLVATPGRLIEFIQKRLFDLTKISHFVLDEVDRMLDMGFIEDVDWIWGQLDNLKQTMTFSATINDEIKHVINKHCDDFIHIRVGEKITVDKIDHTYIDIAHEHKFSTLVHLLKSHPNQKTIIFSQTKRNTEVLTKALKQDKFTCAYLNGDLDQRERNRALRAFKEGECKVLITTDVAARGLNMDNVELVINFDVPREPESYIHRIGRTGRAGADGKALMLVDRDEQYLIMQIEKTQKIKLKKSDTYTGVKDENGDYFDVNLDRPLPPSEKKRRMVARSLAREYGTFQGRGQGGYGQGGRGGYGGNRGGDRRSSFGGGGFGGGRSERSERSDRGNPQRGGYERRDDRPRGSERLERTERSDRGSFNRNTMQDAPRRNNEGSGFSSSRQFDRKPSDRFERNTSYGDKAMGEKGFGQRSFGDRSRSNSGDRNFGRSSSHTGGGTGRSTGRSIGGYDVDFVSAQRALDRDRFTPRGPKKDGPRKDGPRTNDRRR